MSRASELSETLSVSRETVDRLHAFADLVRKWNPKINLVSQSSLADLMGRHIADSAQLYDVVKLPVDHWVDLGSGGGFPGVVIAILNEDRVGVCKITLVESDARKSVFLREVARALSLSVDVLNDRIENLAPLSADVVSARALAPLSVLLGHAHRHVRPEGVAIFPKGTRYQEELDQAAAEWVFTVEGCPSRTDPDARILVVRSISPKTAGRH